MKHANDLVEVVGLLIGALDRGIDLRDKRCAGQFRPWLELQTLISSTAACMCRSPPFVDAYERSAFNNPSLFTTGR